MFLCAAHGEAEIAEALQAADAGLPAVAEPPPPPDAFLRVKACERRRIRESGVAHCRSSGSPNCRSRRRTARRPGDRAGREPRSACRRRKERQVGAHERILVAHDAAMQGPDLLQRRHTAIVQLVGGGEAPEVRRRAERGLDPVDLETCRSAAPQSEVAKRASESTPSTSQATRGARDAAATCWDRNG